MMNSYGVLAELLDYKVIESMGLHKLSVQNQGFLEIEHETFPENKKKRALRETDIKDLTVIEKIAEGQFGPILIANSDKNVYCIKSFVKKRLLEYEVEEFISN